VLGDHGDLHGAGDPSHVHAALRDAVAREAAKAPLRSLSVTSELKRLTTTAKR